MSYSKTTDHLYYFSAYDDIIKALLQAPKQGVAYIFGPGVTNAITGNVEYYVTECLYDPIGKGDS